MFPKKQNLNCGGRSKLHVAAAYREPLGIKIMVLITNFSSVLEIGFAVNAIFFLFAAAPMSDSRMMEKYAEFEKVAEEKKELTQNSEIPPVEFVAQGTYTFFKYVLAAISILLSINCLYLLIRSGFDPEFSMSTLWFSTQLFMILLIVPVCAFLIHIFGIKLMNSAIEYLEDEISNFHQEKYMPNNKINRTEDTSAQS